VRRALRRPHRIACVRASQEHSASMQLKSIGAGSVRAPNYPSRPLAPPAESIASDLGTALASVSASQACYQLGSTYAAMLPDRTRTQLGVFYTPPALAERLLDQAEAAGVNWRTARVLDPAAGTGGFLVPVARRMARAISTANPSIIAHNIAVRLQGWELDPFAAWISTVFLVSELRPILGSAHHRLNRIAKVRDSLADPPAEYDFDLVVGNPPFGKVSLPNSLRRSFERGLYGHANLYGLFTDLSVRVARRGGIISLITPASFLAGEYFKNLRSVLWKEAPPVSLGFVNARKGVFEDVLQETVLGTYRRGGDRRPASVYFVHAIKNRQTKSKKAAAFNLPTEPTAPWILSRTSTDAPLARQLRNLPGRLAQWGYRVCTGPLVWNRHKTQLRDEPAPGRIPLIWAEAVSADGRFEFRSQRRNHKPFFEPKTGDDWLIVHTPCVLVQRTTAKEQARRLIAAEMPREFVTRHTGVTVENHLNMIVPIESSPPVSPAIVTAFFNSSTADRAFRCLSGSVAVSAYELEALPLPSPASIESLSRLVARHAGPLRLDEEVARLYGLM